MERPKQSFFRDKQGNLTAVQKPNSAIIIFTLAIIGSLLADRWLQLGLTLIAGVALLVWSGMEVSSGNSGFRRLLGVIGIVLALMILLNPFFTVVGSAYG